MDDNPRYYVHSRAICDAHQVGDGTSVWAFAHIMDGAQVGANCNIGEHVFIECGVRVGDRVTIKNHVAVWEGVELGDDVFVGPGVMFTNDKYPRSPRAGESAGHSRKYVDEANWLLPTVVQQGATLGAGSILLPGITIGAYALVAAGALVTRDVGRHELVTGQPARPTGWVAECARPLVEKDSMLLCEHCHRHFSIPAGEGAYLRCSEAVG